MNARSLNEINATNLKRKLQSGKKACLAWNQTGTSFSSEIYARAGLDGVILDMEHGPFTLETAVQHCQAVAAYPTTALIRIEGYDPHRIKRVLDFGCYGILVPQISSVQVAKNAVLAAKYPPQGIRGLSYNCRAAGLGIHASKYIEDANNDTIVILMIETVAAVEEIEEIVKIDGLDGVFIGPLDLAAAMGQLGKSNSPELKEAIGHVERVVMESTVFLGSIASEEKIQTMFSRGYDFLSVMSDVMLLSQSAQRIMSKIRNDAEY